MSGFVAGALGLGVAAALVAVLCGAVLSRAVLAGCVAVVVLGLGGLASGGGVLVLCFVAISLLWLVLLQLFGWMLVDVDHDHLPRQAWSTALARLLALGVVAGVLGVLGRAALRSGAFPATPPTPVETTAVGALLVGAGSPLALPIGLVVAAGLLAALGLLRDEESEPG